MHQGGLRDAILHSVGANATHGLRRSNGDKRRAVAILLDDPEWAKWNNSEIARRCAVDETLVRRMRGERASSAEPKIDDTRLVERGGTVYPMKPRASGPKDAEPDAAAPAVLADALARQFRREAELMLEPDGSACSRFSAIAPCTHEYGISTYSHMAPVLYQTRGYNAHAVATIRGID